jgi:predicted ArsR family transcriptional regulator
MATVGNMLKSSRCAIIELLKAQGALSAEELARELEVSKVCVRRHLALLESDGLIRYEEERRERGRPRYLYRLTKKAACLFPRGDDEFVQDVLAQVQQAFGQKGVWRVLSGRADEMIRQLSDEFQGMSLDERVRRLAEVLSEKGYLAEARRLRDGSYRLRQRNCPTESVAVSHPQVCQEELRVYGESLGCEVRRECRIADGAQMCEYRILPPNKRALRVLQP